MIPSFDAPAPEKDELVGVPALNTSAYYVKASLQFYGAFKERCALPLIIIVVRSLRVKMREHERGVNRRRHR